MTTPRSIEKHKKNLTNKLKRAMEENLRIKAQNKSLKDVNQKYIDAFSVKDQKS